MPSPRQKSAGGFCSLPPKTETGQMLSTLTILMAAVLGWCGTARAETYNAYAGPNTWGPALQVKGHVGSVTYTISYSAVGNTSVIGEVTYDGPGGQVTKQFNGSITFTTGRVY